MRKEVSHTEASFDHEKFHRSSNQSRSDPNLQVPIKKLHFQLDEIAQMVIKKYLNNNNNIAQSGRVNQNLNYLIEKSNTISNRTADSLKV